MWPAARRNTSDLLQLVEQRSGQNVFACYQCGKCTAGCPFSLEPQRVMRLLQLGQVEEAMAHPTTWECASCYTCETTCPKGLSPAHVHRTLRTVSGNGHAHGHGHALRTWMLTHVDELWRVGNALHPLSTWAMRLPGAGLINEGLLGIHRRRALRRWRSPRSRLGSPAARRPATATAAVPCSSTIPSWTTTTPASASP